MAIKVTVTDNSEEVLENLKKQMAVAAEKCGLIAEGYAKRLCPVDTGRLRNSITHASSGNSGYEYSYKNNPGDNFSYAVGSVGENDHAAYIGTNVEYAEIVEKGIGRNPKPYLAPAVEDHMDEYKEILHSALQGK